MGQRMTLIHFFFGGFGDGSDLDGAGGASDFAADLGVSDLAGSVLPASVFPVSVLEVSGLSPLSLVAQRLTLATATCTSVAIELIRHAVPTYCAGIARPTRDS